MAWDALEANKDSVPAAVESAAQAVSLMREASYALQALEDVRAAQQQSLADRHHAEQPAAAAPGSPLVGSSAPADSSGGGGRSNSSSPSPTEGSSTSGSGGSVARAQAASDSVEAAVMRLLQAQGKGAKEQRRALDHLRAVLETYTDVVRYPR